MSDVKDFSDNSFTTLVVSDLHLTEEHKPDAKYPLWKKYKTKAFFFDDVFSEWLERQCQITEGKLELVLNGDIFDFDSVTTFPDKPTYKISEFEKSRTMFSQQEKSSFKIEKIIEDHPLWFDSICKFLQAGNRVVFVIGNHDLELHFFQVQRILRKRLVKNESEHNRLKFCEWFYISGGDTHIEHGNQYDPFCVCQSPVAPLIKVRGDLRVRIPFGNMTARYMVNMMGFFNPHSEENYSLSFAEYINFFFRFLIRKQPLIIWTWFYSSITILYRSILYKLREPVVDALSYENRIDSIAEKSLTSPRVVRQLLGLSAPTAVSSPWAVAQVLWIDRALLFLLGILFCLQLFLILDQIIHVNFYWMLIPLLALAPFFIFYSSTVRNRIKGSKYASGKLLATIGLITKTNRVVFGHTHEIKHEIVGAVEYLNPGSWSPVFEDLACTRPLTKYAYVKISPTANGREAYLLEWKNNEERDYFSGKKI